MKTEKKTHGLFWRLLQETEGYKDAYKEVIKEGIVHQYSGGKTTSLSEMYERYPAAYAKMVEAMKGPYKKRTERYRDEQDKNRKRVIAAICGWLDKIGYKFATRQEKIDYAKACACRAASCSSFNKIPSSKLTAISFLYNNKTAVDITCLPLDSKVSQN